MCLYVADCGNVVLCGEVFLLCLTGHFTVIDWPFYCD